MFPSLRLDVMERFTGAKQLFRNSRKGLGKGELPQAVKGLSFVQIYAIYEHTVREVTRLAIKEIANHAHPYSNLKFHLLAIFLDPQMKSLRDCGESDVWQRRFELLEQAASEKPVVSVEVMPHDGSHFKHTQVELMLKMLGVRKTLTYRKRHLYEIDEIVHNRNTISHGEEPAASVGRRYSRADIWKSFHMMERTCLRLIQIVSEHCSAPEQHRD